MKKKAPAGATNQVRIIGGIWRSRRISFHDVQGLRPTPDRVRETVFNWLQAEISGAHCLDMFAGSGAMGFEALSRGADSMVMIEFDAKQAVCLKQSAEILKAENLTILHGDSLKVLPKESARIRPQDGFDVVFLDPPFHKGMLENALGVLVRENMLRDGGWVYMETERPWSELALDGTFELYRETRAGLVNSYLTRYQKASV